MLFRKNADGVVLDAFLLVAERTVRKREKTYVDSIVLNSTSGGFLQ